MLPNGLDVNYGLHAVVLFGNLTSTFMEISV